MFELPLITIINYQQILTKRKETENERFIYFNPHSDYIIRSTNTYQAKVAGIE
jgi:hypothetical protein